MKKKQSKMHFIDFRSKKYYGKLTPPQRHILIDLHQLLFRIKQGQGMSETEQLEAYEHWKMKNNAIRRQIKTEIDNRFKIKRGYTLNDGQKMLESQENLATWDDVQPQKQIDFVRFRDPEPVTQVFGITDWSLIWSEERDFNDNTKQVRKVRFVCDVLSEDGVSVNKKISTTSSRFINAIKPVLQDKDSKDIVYVEITKIGHGIEVKYSIKISTNRHHHKKIALNNVD